MEGKIQQLNILGIQMPDGFNPRMHTGKDENLLALGQSIEQIGQLAPVIVNYKEGKYWLIAGQRRIEAARNQGKTTIEAKVFSDLDATTMLRMTLAENRHRKELNAIEEARGMQMLVEAHFDDKHIAKEFNYTLETVRRRLNLLKLPDDIQQMITRKINPLPVHQAYMLYGLSQDQQRQAAREIAPTTGPIMTEPQAKEIIDKFLGEKLDLDTADLDKRPGLPIPKGAKPPKLKTGKKPKEKPAERPTRQQKNAVPKKLKGKKTIGPEIDINICGKINMAFAVDGILDFDEPTIILKIGNEKEKFYKEPLAIDIGQPEKSKIVTAIAEYLKTAIATKGKK